MRTRFALTPIKSFAARRFILIARGIVVLDMLQYCYVLGMIC